MRCFTIVLLFIPLSFILPTNSIISKEGEPPSMASNYVWALKIIGKNDANRNHPSNVDLVFEVGSRDLLDGNRLADWYNASVVSFEASPENWIRCKNHNNDPRVRLVESAVSDRDGEISFYPYNLTLYQNRGASSMFLSDFVTNRSPTDPDYNRSIVQYEVRVPSVRLDTFIRSSPERRVPDMMCLDVQEAEFIVLQSMGPYLSKLKYLIMEVSFHPQYNSKSNFTEMDQYLQSHGLTMRAIVIGTRVLFSLNERVIANSGGGDVLYINDEACKLPKSELRVPSDDVLNNPRNPSSLAKDSKNENRHHSKHSGHRAHHKQRPLPSATGLVQR